MGLPSPKARTIVLTLLLGLSLVNCSDTGFNAASPTAGASGKNGKNGKSGGADGVDGDLQDGSGGKIPSGTDIAIDGSDSSGNKPGSVLLEEEIGQALLTPDYATCVARPNSKISYPAKCAENNVMVVINDGKTQEMTCCPVKEARIFSKTAAELYQERTGRCEANEVGVGMISAGSSKIYCSKINTDLVELGPSQNAKYAKSGSGGLTPELQSLAQIYNVGDTCACPDRMILVGGHSTQDNVCQDQCVEILTKKK